jgi:hypothetical protein
MNVASVMGSSSLVITTTRRNSSEDLANVAQLWPAIDRLDAQLVEQAPSIAEAKNTLRELFELTQTLISQQNPRSSERATSLQIRGRISNSDLTVQMKVISTMYVSEVRRCTQSLIKL